MNIATTAFEPQRRIPKKFTCDGEDVNPELSISDSPSNPKDGHVLAGAELMGTYAR